KPLSQKTKPSHALCGSSIALALAAPGTLLSSHAHAQASPANPTLLSPAKVTGEAERAYEVPEAAQVKFTAPLLDTPKSVQGIPKAVIQDSAATSLQDVLRNAPGITFGAGEGGQPLADRPFIRGSASAGNVYVD